ncbi:MULTISPECIES: cytochrome c [unclassified Moraxella]|uniref:c-type cytochrome n=1 Tax=unclassified Moraxella TaxID=2685852 RepID=UPI002B404416|nr:MULTISPECIES: cytochrome c [unclassified Moraxella]
MKSSNKTFVVLIASALMLVACNSASQSPNDIKTRQNIMQDWRAANDIMKSMVEKPDTFDAATFKEQADFIKESTNKAWESFADSANKGKSQDAVWSDGAGFKAQADEFNAIADELSAIAKEAQSADDVSRVLGRLNESCGSCHKTYKQK